MASLGEVFKQIRIGKKLSLKEVSGDYLSVSFLSKFERGQSEISLSRFLMLLENLDISIEEFYKLATYENPNENDQLIDKVSKAFYNNNLPVFENIGATSWLNMSKHKKQNIVTMPS